MSILLVEPILEVSISDAVAIAYKISALIKKENDYEENFIIIDTLLKDKEPNVLTLVHISNFKDEKDKKLLHHFVEILAKSSF